MRVAAAEALGEVGEARELPVLENAVRDAQPAHVGGLRGRDIEQPVVAPAEIVRRLGRFVLARLLLQPLVGVEWMLLALEFLLVGELAAGRRDSSCALMWIASGPVGSARPPLRSLAARGARRVEAGHEAFEVALLVGREIAGHVTPPCALGERAAEGEIVADASMERAGADQIEIPEPVRGIAEQHRADEAAVRDDELLVGAEAGIARARSASVPGRADEIAGREHVDAGDLQIGGEHAAGVVRVLARKVSRKHARLLVGRLDQPVADAAMLGAFADRVDAGPAGPQAVVDHDAALDVDTGVARQVGVRPDADRHHDDIGFDLRPSFSATPSTRPFADDRGGFGIEDDLDALRLDGALQHRGGVRIELALHQPIHQMQHRDLRAGLGEAVGRFKPEQAAADHHDARAPLRDASMAADVVEVAERHDARADSMPGTLSRIGCEPVANTSSGIRQGLAVGEPHTADRGSIAVARQP